MEKISSQLLPPFKFGNSEFWKAFGHHHGGQVAYRFDAVKDICIYSFRGYDNVFVRVNVREEIPDEYIAEMLSREIADIRKSKK